MANLHYDYCALIIYGVIVFSMISRKVLKGSTNLIFFNLLLISVAGTLTDIISELPGFPPVLRLLCDYGYFIAAIFIPLLYTVYIYSSIGLLSYLKNTPRLWLWLSGPLVLHTSVIAANIFTDCAFWVTENGDYVRGPYQILLILASFWYLLAGVFVILKWRSIIRREKIIALLTFFPTIAIGMILQQIWKGLELNMFCVAISLLIISFTVQRQGEDYNKITNTKDMIAAMEKLRTIFITKQQAIVIYTKVCNQDNLRQVLGTMSYNSFIHNMCSGMKQLITSESSDVELFYINDGIFAFVLTGQTVLISEMLASKIDRLFQQNIVIDNVSVSVNAITCIVRIPQDINNLESLMNFRLNFDKKLPEKSSYHILSNYLDSKDFKIKNELDKIITRSLTENHLQMYYQPIYSLKEKKFVSCEALIRLIDPEFGFVSPALFIPAAETNGTIHQIGDFVLEDVCRFINRNEINKYGLKYVEVNLSVNQCIESDLIEKIEKYTETNCIHPDQINFEITETAAGFNPEMMDSNIYTLHQEGYSFSLDDYGTGYSNIKRVTTLPVEIVKLDKTFVDEMEDSEMWSVLVNTINMFKELNKQILVEGVETQQQLEKLSKLGCDYIQGYVFSKPLPEKEFLQFLKENNQ